ncbi:MAG: GTP-binding protein [Candidatus Heimdallarchaeota archaeon]|nr:GTP-binding protein [Candidatus Heimdallarchaeota archaeon]MCK5143633.1 GTP-binding protein [Candidatus Heimdallarchaeota archaeon]
MGIKKQPVNFVILGLENAGKTTLLRNISGKKYTETFTTIGINIEQLRYRGLDFQAIDVGGQLHFRETMWQYYTTLAKGVIFVFDIFDRSKFAEAKKWFEYISHRLSKKAVLMFLANKIDLKDEDDTFLTTEEIITMFKLDNVSQYPERSFRIWETSAKTGENVNNAISWMFNKLVDFIKEESRISFVLILDQNNKTVYKTSITDNNNEFETVINKCIIQMKDLGANENMISIQDYSVSIRTEKDYCVVVGADNGVSKDDLSTATLSIAQLINNDFYPPEKYKKQLEEVVNFALLKQLNNK